MNGDPASLDNLRDITVLPPVSWWPLAPGWWFVIVVVAAALIVAAIRAWKTWKAKAYRRAAAKELDSAKSVAEIADILKRAALSAYPRVDVASLSGDRWCRWLEETSGTAVPSSVQQSLTADVFGDHGNPSTAETVAFAAKWIKSHRTPSTLAASSASIETAG